MKNISLMLLALDCPGAYHKVALSDQERDVLADMRDGSKWVARQVAECHKVSRPHASIILNKLHKKGYLNREDIGSETGGREYEYTLIEQLHDPEVVNP